MLYIYPLTCDEKDTSFPSVYFFPKTNNPSPVWEIHQTPTEGHSTRHLTSLPQIPFLKCHRSLTHGHSQGEPKEMWQLSAVWPLDKMQGRKRTLMGKWWNPNTAQSSITCSVPMCTSLSWQRFQSHKMRTGRNRLGVLWELSVQSLKLFHKTKIILKMKVYWKRKNRHNTQFTSLFLYL